METNGSKSATDAAGPDEPPFLEVVDGYLVDAQGEVVGLADDQATGRDMDRFEVRDEAGADWVLKLRMQEEARVASIEAQRAAINANLDGLLVAPRNRLKFLAFRFDGELERYARQELGAGKASSKTLKLTYGQVSFRQARGSSEITDKARALEYVEEWAPAKVCRLVGVDAVKAAIESERLAGQEPQVDDFFRAAEPREVVTIRTGIGKESAR